jgi:hypothetical protein
MKIIINTILLSVVMLTGAANAATCTTTSKQDWDQANWTGCTVNNGSPSTGSNVVIASGAQIKVDNNPPSVANLAVNSGGTLEVTNKSALTSTGTLTVGGTFTAKNGSTTTLNNLVVNTGGTFTANETYISGNITVNGTFTASNKSAIYLTGTNQTITGNITFENLNVAAGTTLTLSGNVVVNGTATGLSAATFASTCPTNYTVSNRTGKVLYNSCSGGGGGTGGGVINTYYPGVGSITAGTTSINLGTATGASTQIAAGDMLLIMEMQDATMDSSNSATYGTVTALNAGKYEYAIASNSVSLTGGTLNISCGILNAYNDAAASGTSGQHRYQVIRVPVYASTILSSTLTAQAWNGSTGGVLALDATGTLSLNSATVSVDGMGFRGGAGRNSTSGNGTNTDYVTLVSNQANGSKGEGIAGTPDNTLTPPGTSNATGSAYPNGSYARGAPANGGGGGTDINPAANDENSGGGGGGNGGTGGVGGIGWCPTFNTAGPTYGCGLASLVSATNPNGSTGGIGGLTINAKGGTGGFNLVPPGSTSTPHGPGGGGGGGFIITSGSPAATSMAGGCNGETYNNGARFVQVTCTTDSTASNGLSYGATPGSNGIVNSGLVTAAIPGAALGSASCSAAVDHFAINIGGASGSTCAAKSITITAQDASNTTVTTYANLISVTTSPAHGNWSGGTPAPGGTLTPGTVDSGSAGYQFVAGDKGVVTLNLSNQHADGNLTIKVADSALPSTLSTSSTISFSDNAFVISNDTVQVAGRPQAMNAAMWRKDPATGVCSVSAYYTGSKNLKAWLTLDTADPGGASPSIGALSLPNGQPGSNNLSLTFSAGSASFNLNTSDVGKYALNLRDDSGTFAGTPGSPIQINSTSNTITTRPFALVVSNIKQGSTLNPANNSSGGAVFAKAGTSFQATVGAYLWNSAADVNSDGIPDAGKSLAQITANGATPSYKWTTTLAAGIPFTPLTPLDPPINTYTGTTGSFGNGVQTGTCSGSNTNCFTSGIATPINLSYSEVGSFTLGVSATGFLGTSGVNMTGANGLALVFDNTPALNDVVGRFIPDHFGVSVNSIINRADLCPVASGCPSAFTYMGERMNAVFTLTALATGGTTTRNYETGNGFAKLNPATAGNPLGLTALNDNGTTRTPLNPLDTSLPATCSPTSCFIGGVASVVAPIAVTRGATPVGPYTAVNVGINPSESDGVKTIFDIDTTNVVAGAFDHTRIGTTTEYYGRINLSSAHGSELLPLPIDVTAEYYGGTGYVTSSNDNISSIKIVNLVFSNCLPLSATSTWPSGTGGTCPPTSPSPASVVFKNGSGGFTLSIPGNSNTGSVDMNFSVPSYLPSNTARATFGVYKGPNKFIYRREEY